MVVIVTGVLFAVLLALAFVWLVSVDFDVILGAAGGLVHSIVEH